MTMDFDAPSEVSGDGGNFLSSPGTYHLVITEIKEGEGPNGGAIDGFTASFDCLAGTTKDCQGKTFRETLFAPNLNQSENSQTMARRKLAAFFIATGVMQPAELGKSGLLIDVNESNGKQLVLRLEQRMDKDPESGKYTVPTKYLQISYSDIFHVDDPEVKDIPKHADAVAMIPADQRHDAIWFAFKAKSNSGTANQPVGASAGANVAIDEL